LEGKLLTKAVYHHPTTREVIRWRLHFLLKIIQLKLNFWKLLLNVKIASVG